MILSTVSMLNKSDEYSYPTPTSCQPMFTVLQTLCCKIKRVLLEENFILITTALTMNISVGKSKKLNFKKFLLEMCFKCSEVHYFLSLVTL